MKTVTNLFLIVLLLFFLISFSTKIDTSSEELKFNTFHKLKITDIHTQGWIKEFLEKQRTGLTGIIEVAGYPFNTKIWATEKLKTQQKHGGLMNKLVTI